MGNIHSMAVSAAFVNNKEKFDLQTVPVENEISESRTEGPKQQGRFVCHSSLSRLYVGHFISILLCGVVVWDDRGLSACLSAI